jgi:hypothetical protein
MSTYLRPDVGFLAQDRKGKVCNLFFREHVMRIEPDDDSDDPPLENVTHTDYFTHDGLAVLYIEKGKYRVIVTGEELISNSPVAP